MQKAKLLLSIDAGLKEQIKQAAKDAGLPMTLYVELLLKAHTGKPCQVTLGPSGEL